MKRKLGDGAGVGVTRRKALEWIAGTAGALATGRTCAAEATATSTKGSAVAWDKLQAKLQGRVISRQDREYERDRQAAVWNVLKPGRFPDAIVHVVSEQDVREAVRFARQQDMKVAVRGGGHSFRGWPLRQGGLLLDLTQLNTMKVDAAGRTAAIQPVVTALDLATNLAAQGLAFPAGHCASTALSGYLLNGGVGWNSNAWGPACMSIKAIEMVNAAGESIRADPEQNAELYWAARGAGPGFFGIVTRYHLQMYPLPSVIRMSTVTYRLEDAGRVGEWLPQVVRGLPPQVELNCFIISAPPEAPKPAADRRAKLFVVTAAAFADAETDARRWLQPLADAPPSPERQIDLDHAMSFPSLYEVSGRLFSENRRYAADSFSTNAPLGEVLTRLREPALSVPSPESFLLLSLPSPRPAPAPPLPDMAFSLSGSAFISLYGIWRDPAQDAVNEQWVRQTSKLLDPIKANYYIGETDLTLGGDRARLSYAASNWQRLQQLKKKYDPDDVFFSYLTPA
jgi:FAD/FMN-containing dehydrogenase